MERLEKALAQGAYAFGYTGNNWTLDRIAQVIWQLFEVRYHSSHKRKAVQEFLNRHKRLHMDYFPIAALKLNPAEFIWTQVTEYTAGTAPHHGAKLQINIYSAIARTRMFQKRLQACLLGSRLNWINK